MDVSSAQGPREGFQHGEVHATPLDANEYRISAHSGIDIARRRRVIRVAARATDSKSDAHVLERIGHINPHYDLSKTIQEPFSGVKDARWANLPQPQAGLGIRRLDCGGRKVLQIAHDRGE